jgi:hypothetical protein
MRCRRMQQRRGPDRCDLQTTAPTSLPIPAVRAMASAPQNVTRAVACTMFAPPALAPIAPRSEKNQGGTRHDGKERTSGRYDDHEPGHSRAYGERCSRSQRGLHGTRRSGRGNPQLIARVGSQGIFRRELMGDLPRKRRIDTALCVDPGKFIQFKRGIVAQFYAFAREIRPLCVGLRADGHILAGGH